MSNFQQKLAVGKMGESQIAKWFLKKGYAVLPVYEKEIKEFKGPVLFMPSGDLSVAPDMLVFKSEKLWWIEAKHKSAFTWHRITKRWTTGIDLSHYQDYLLISTQIQIPVWLLFLHKEGIAKDTPAGMISPTGLYGNDISYLSKNENYRHSNWGKSGMVYWAVNNLKKLACIEDFEERSAIGEIDFSLTQTASDITATENFITRHI